MYQKYFAYHTLLILLAGLLLELFSVEPFHITENDFTSIIGKFIYLIFVVWLVIPILSNWLSMLGNSIKKGRFLWVLLALFLGPLATVPYYFIIYRNNENI